VEVGIGSGNPSNDFKVPGDHDSEEEEPHFIPDRLPEVDRLWGELAPNASRQKPGERSPVEMKNRTVKATVAGREGMYP
jgi:hypothetical protein